MPTDILSLSHDHTANGDYLYGHTSVVFIIENEAYYTDDTSVIALYDGG